MAEGDDIAAIVCVAFALVVLIAVLKVANLLEMAAMRPLLIDFCWVAVRVIATFGAGVLLRTIPATFELVAAFAAFVAPAADVDDAFCPTPLGAPLVVADVVEVVTSNVRSENFRKRTLLTVSVPSAPLLL
jgi:hypothetical protein